MQITGTGSLPGLHLSSSAHNFGPCFIYRAGMPANTFVLKMTNRDKKDLRYYI